MEWAGQGRMADVLVGLSRSVARGLSITLRVPKDLIIIYLGFG